MKIQTENMIGLVGVPHLEYVKTYTSWSCSTVILEYGVTNFEILKQ